MANGPVVAPKTFVLDLIEQYCKCQGCARKLKKINKLLEKIHGIHSTSIDSNAGRVTVTITGFVDPQEVIWVLKRNNIKADVLLEEIIPSTDNHKMQIATLSRRVDQESHKQNLVAQVQQFVDNSGLKELELTFKATFNGKNKDKMTTSLESDTHKKIVMDDDQDHCPKSQGHCCGRHGGGAHVCHGGVPNCSPCGQVHNPYNSYGGNYGLPLESNSWPPAPCGGPPIDVPETPWQRDYFLPPAPVAGYEPSAPPWYGNHDESPSSGITSPMVVFLLVVVIYLLLFR